MINSRESNQLATENELVIKEQFENLKYSVTRLDSRKSKRRRPDFLISDSSGPQMLCEVKTVVSGGYPRDKTIYGVQNVHLSMLDNKFWGQFGNIPIDLSKIDNGLADAVDKRKALIEDDPDFANLPLLVAFFFDVFAEYLPFYPRSFDQRDKRFREISGILTIREDAARTKVFDKLKDEEQERCYQNAELTADLPPHSKHFALVRNKAASREVPASFQTQCIVEPYNASF